MADGSIPQWSREDLRRFEDRLRLHKARQMGPLRGRLALFWLTLGPGILVMLGENDAGSMLTYASTGAQLGLGLFLLLVPLSFAVAFVVQEMAMRLGAVTHRGHGELIFERFGPFWGGFSLFDLAIGNLLTIVTEFIGMGAGLLGFGVPLWLGVSLSAALVLLISRTGRYWTWERLTLALSLFNLIFFPLLVAARPSWGGIGTAFLHPSLPGGLTNGVLFLIIANLGATVTPWMIFFQQGAVVDKGITAREIGHARLDTLVGALLANVAGLSAMILTAVVLYPRHILPHAHGGVGFAQALQPFLGPLVAHLFSLGLFESGFVAAVTISLSSSWAIGEVFRLPKSLNRSFREARIFYLVYVGSIVVAAVVVLWPGAPLTAIALTVQVINTILMPPALLFLLLLLNDRALMGERVNRLRQNLVGGSLVLLLLFLSALYGVTLMFPGLLG